MKEIEAKLMQLRDQTWQAARESLDSGETNIYRSLTDIAEKLTKLIGSSDKSTVATINNAEMLPIFAMRNGKRYDAQLDTARIEGRRGHCVLMEGKWWTASGSAFKNTNTPTDGWTNFWRYNKNGVSKPIDELRN